MFANVILLFWYISLDSFHMPVAIYTFLLSFSYCSTLWILTLFKGYTQTGFLIMGTWESSWEIPWDLITEDAVKGRQLFSRHLLTDICVFFFFHVNPNSVLSSCKTGTLSTLLYVSRRGILWCLQAKAKKWFLALSLQHLLSFTPNGK